MDWIITNIKTCRHTCSDISMFCTTRGIRASNDGIWVILHEIFAKCFVCLHFSRMIYQLFARTILFYWRSFHHMASKNSPLLYSCIVQPCRHLPQVATANFNVATKAFFNYNEISYLFAYFYQYLTNMQQARLCCQKSGNKNNFVELQCCTEYNWNYTLKLN